MTAEYYAAGAVCMSIMHHRQFATYLGWPPTDATTLYLDNKIVINLVQAPEVIQKSRHIGVKHHYIRQIHGRKLIQMVYLASSNLRSDIMTNFLPRAQFVTGICF